ncbi:MAG: cobalamin-dependent protein, partial [Gammaproteobacteria bacterium]|nr:cobalamin-dependent protein [Gammaproteobacteria bacterium]
MITNQKVALVTPPLLKEMGHHPIFPPLGLAYMAAVLEQNGVEVKIYDCPVCRFDYEKLKAELDAYQPTIVGIGSMTPTIESAFKSARIAKEACPDAKV